MDPMSATDARPDTEPTDPLVEVLDDQQDRELQDAPDAEILAALEEMVGHPQYPCLGARSVFQREAAEIVVLGDMCDPDSLEQLSDALAEYGSRADPAGAFVSFIAVFRGPEITDEKHFEALLWDVLQRLHDGDDQPWAPGVDADPDQAHFAFSHAGVPYFIVGLHPQASRVARRTPLPTLVFNLHEQFEMLRGTGSFERMRDTIRRRDAQLQGEVNPMAADHGDVSEARQYAGRQVEDDWQAPFRSRQETP